MKTFFEEYEEGRKFAQRRERVQQIVRNSAKKRLKKVAVSLVALASFRENDLTGANAQKLVIKQRQELERNNGLDIVSESLLDIKRDVVEGLQEVNDFLGIEANDNGVREFIEGIHFGKTFDEREEEYGKHFLLDIAIMIAAGRFLGYNKENVSARISEEFEKPYGKGTLIGFARSQGFSFIAPSYGMGVVRAGAGALLNNVSDTIALGWEEVRIDHERENGAIGYYVFRGSTYPCHLCDDETGWLHSLDEPGVPVHNHCRCFMVYVHSLS